MVKFIHWLDEHLEEMLLTLLLIGISVLVVGQVFARYLFNHSLSWSDELARYFLIWSAFLSVSYCVKKRISIKIDQFQNSLSKPVIPWIKMFRHTIVFSFCVIMIPYAWTYVLQSVHSGATSSALQLPMVYIQSAPLIGFFLLMIRVAQAWLREFKRSWRYLALSFKQFMKNQIKEKEEAV